MLLLDTCALLILGGRQDDLPEKALAVLRDNAGDLYVSTISAFEIVLKTKLNKLDLPLPAEEWYRKAIDFYELTEIPISSDIAMVSASLPFIHKDPCDRIVIATALENRMKIVTADTIIPQYPDVKTVWR
jgi:PIN domain nuclease of toxin-antitoxin system